VQGDAPARIDLREAPRALRDCLGLPDEFLARFDPAVGDGEVYLGRTHPAVESLANHVLNAALDPFAAGPARRCGVIRTSKVTTRTTLLLLRHPVHIVTRTPRRERQLLAQDAPLAALPRPRPRRPLPRLAAEPGVAEGRGRRAAPGSGAGRQRPPRPGPELSATGDRRHGVAPPEARRDRPRAGRAAAGGPPPRPPGQPGQGRQ